MLKVNLVVWVFRTIFLKFTNKTRFCEFHERASQASSAQTKQTKYSVHERSEHRERARQPQSSQIKQRAMLIYPSTVYKQAKYQVSQASGQAKQNEPANKQVKQIKQAKLKSCQGKLNIRNSTKRRLRRDFQWREPRKSTKESTSKQASKANQKRKQAS